MSLVVAAYRDDLAVPWTKTSTYRPRSFAVSGPKKLGLTTSIVPWRNPDTQTIPTQTENGSVPFGLRAWFDCAL